MSRCDGCGSCSQGLSGTGESCSAGGCALTQHPNNVSIFHVLLGRQWPRVLAQSGHRDLAMGLRVGAGHRRGGGASRGESGGPPRSLLDPAVACRGNGPERGHDHTRSAQDNPKPKRMVCSCFVFNLQGAGWGLNDRVMAKLGRKLHLCAFLLSYSKYFFCLMHM